MAKKQILLDDEAKKRIVEKTKLTKEECFSLDAYIVSTLPITEKKRLTYSMTRKKEPTDNLESLDQMVYRWFKKLGVKYYLEDREIELFGAKREKESNGNNIGIGGLSGNVTRSKEETLEELNELATITTEAKLKAELLMKIAELQQWKKKEETDQESQIKYFMPLKCTQCTLYKTAKMTKDSTENIQY